MAIEPNKNPDSGSLLNGVWIEFNEDGFRADSTRQRENADAAGTSQGIVNNVRGKTSDTLQGASGDKLQEVLSTDTTALGTNAERHVEAAGHLDSAAGLIEDTKVAMNGVDANYHAQKTALLASAVASGASPAETQAATDNLMMQAQAQIAGIRSQFDTAYNGIVSTLGVTAGGPAPATPGTVPLPPVDKPGTPNTPGQMGQNVGAGATDFAAGLLSGVTGGSPNSTTAGMTPGMTPGMNPSSLAGMPGLMPGMQAPGMMPGMANPASPLNQIGQSLGSLLNQGLPTNPASPTLPGAQAAPSSLANLLNGTPPGLNAANPNARDALTGLADQSVDTGEDDIDKRIDKALDNVLGDDADKPTDADKPADADKPVDSASDTADKPTDDTQDSDTAASADTESDAPVDPVTRLQSGLHDTINGTAAAANNAVDNIVGAATNNSIGIVNTAPSGMVTADTVGLGGPQHIEATTHTSADSAAPHRADAFTAPASPTAAPTQSPAFVPPLTPAAPVGSPGVMPPAAAAPAAPTSSPGTTETLGRHHRPDPPAAPGAVHIGSADSVAARTAAVGFLTLLPASVAAAHQRLALVRAQQMTTGAVTATALGVFTTPSGAETYVVATGHGISYLPLSAAVPAGAKMLTELPLPDDFYATWCGYSDPVTKLAAYSADENTAIGHLTYVLASTPVNALPGADVAVQTTAELRELVEHSAYAATGRSRADLATAKGRDIGDEIRNAVQDMGVVIRDDHYLTALTDATAAQWTDESGADTYLTAWRRFLITDMQRALSTGRHDEAWYAVDELERVRSTSRI